ncbi:PREDICTED: trichohyalin-like [Wasmannia auropunctata]|uniref:trichohyalin-like n=1 Tax=Wasmannia auropunctata TaxID=64793 RepID=UPI0005F035BC|nr:PREDICTED: trichohyalin-like [Wasmannia auropunctata]
MADKELAGSSGVGKMGRGKVVGKVESRQRRLTSDEGLRVTFSGQVEFDKLKKELIKEVGEELKELKEERKVWKEEREEYRKREREWEIKRCNLEERIAGLEKWKKEREEKVESEEEERVRSESRDGRSVRSIRSAGSVSSGSRGSEDRLSVREVERLKRFVSDKEREERRNNVIIRGVKMEKEIEGDRKKCAEWIKSWFKEKLGVEGGVVFCRKSGTVLLVKLESEGIKREVMRNKSKLKGESIYIENDLSWEERRIQEKINRWVRGQKGKGIDLKVGHGRVRVGNVWWTWEELEREEEEKEDKGKEKEGQKGGAGKVREETEKHFA